MNPRRCPALVPARQKPVLLVECLELAPFERCALRVANGGLGFAFEFASGAFAGIASGASAASRDQLRSQVVPVVEHFLQRLGIHLPQPILEALVEIAEDIGYAGGIYGCRMTGGGFGGCCVALVKTKDVDSITQKIAAEYKAKTGIEASIFSSRPAAVAAVLKG